MWIRSFLKSSIGGKTVMAITGLALSGFVLAHMGGNLLVYAGPDVFNAYSHALQANKPLLWSMRSGLLAMFLIHISLAFRLTRQNRVARPEKYSYPATIQATAASRTMIHTGMLLLAYVIYHLLHFTTHTVNATEYKIDHQGRHDAYSMVIDGFNSPAVSAVYIIAMFCLFMHLRHGFSSVWQSLGMRHPKYSFLTSDAGKAFAFIVVVGLVSVPVCVLAGFLR